MGDCGQAVRAITYPLLVGQIFLDGRPYPCQFAAPAFSFSKRAVFLIDVGIPTVDQHLCALFEEQSVMTDLLADLVPITVLWWRERPNGLPYTRLGNQESFIQKARAHG